MVGGRTCRLYTHKSCGYFRTRENGYYRDVVVRRYGNVIVYV